MMKVGPDGDCWLEASTAMVELAGEVELAAAQWYESLPTSAVEAKVIAWMPKTSQAEPMVCH